jgi:predicted TIM-barrel fold metal-dependent hydrolase
MNNSAWTRRTIRGDFLETSDAVTLVDTHHHLWDLTQNHYPWLSDRPDPNFFLGNYDALKRNYLPRDYLEDTRQHNVLMTVHCEAETDRIDPVSETRWLSEIQRRHGFPSAVVAHASFDRPDAEETLAAQASFALVRGIRSKPVTASSPRESVRGAAGTMQDDAWLRGLALLEKYRLAWDARVPSWHLRELAEIARAFPAIRIILNHTGLPWDRSDEGLSLWRADMAVLSVAPNVALKVSEFGLRDQPWDYGMNLRVVRDAIAIFGIDRCMFASNFPVAGLRIDFDTLVRSVRKMLADYSEPEQEAFFFRNAIRYYDLLRVM